MGKFLSNFLSKLLVLIGFMGLAGVSFGQLHSTDQIEVELVSETTTVVPGETFWLAVRLDPIEHWHTYWKFGGDSGEATETSEWEMPPGTEIGDIVWPIPEWTPFLGSELVTFTYEREVLLPFPVTVPAGYSGASFDLSARIDWQVCEEICIPGNARFALSLPVADQIQVDEQWQQAFAETRAHTPVALGEHDLQAQFNAHDDKVNVMVKAPEAIFSDVDEAWFFPTERRIMRYAPYRKVMLDGDRIQISTEQHRRYPNDLNEMVGTLAWIDDAGAWHAYDIQPRLSAVAWDHSIEVELLAENQTIVPGETTWLGIRLDPAEHWHTYWKMGGDSGEPTSLNEWSAPDGATIGEIQWPAPHWLPFYDTDLVNFGYEQEVLLPVAVTLPADYAEETASFSTLAYWNVCDQICIPGEQRLSVTLPVADSAATDAENASLFAAARAELPRVEHDIKSIIAVAGDRVSLGFESSDTLFSRYSDAWFFPDQRRIIKPGPLRDVSIQDTLLQITHQQPRRMLTDLSEVYGVLVLSDEQGQREAFEFLDPAADANLTTISALAAPGGSTGGGAGGGGSLALFMLLAMAGGMILNLMPCVFPVLSIKALSFTNNIGESVHKQRMDGIVYTAGVITAFVVLASILIALRAGGEAVGWAFQFQQPWFLAFIVYLFFLMGLSLSGVFEIGTGLMGAGSGLVAKGGYKGSFFTGVLATTVATPCTAPFMGPAIGFALTQSWLVAMLVFIALGFGMALPILVLSYVPALFRYLPKPGPWMETFKQVMAFPLYASALFFLWVLGNQTGVMGMSLVLGVCILMAFAAWLYQRRFTMGPLMRGSNYAVSAAVLLLAVTLTQSPFLATQASSPALTGGGEGAGNDYEVFSSVRLDELRAEGRPVFVNMTAAWCITCLANEQTTLSTDRVKQAMAEHDITYMKGDWTNEDPEISAVLEAFNRPSVPLYVLYPGGLSTEPVILPQILRPGVVIEAFENI